MRIIHTEIRINASAEQVWKALMASIDIPVEIRDAIRERRIGQPLKVPMDSGGRSVTLTVKILKVDPSREIRWRGHLWIPGLFDGEHSFVIREETRGTTLLAQCETFTGLLLPFLSNIVEQTKKEFESVNAAIKYQAEIELT